MGPNILSVYRQRQLNVVAFEQLLIVRELFALNEPHTINRTAPKPTLFMIMAETSANYPGQAVVQFELVYPGSAPVHFDNTIVTHLSSLMHETVDGMSSYEHSFSSISVDYVDKLLKRSMSTGYPAIRCRLGFGTPDKMLWLPWQNHLISDYGAANAGLGNQAGHEFVIKSVDSLMFLNYGSRISAHRGSISAMVSSICSGFGLEQTVIEPTHGQAIYVQNLVTDYNFIRSKLQPRARNERNRGDYLFYARDNVVHFHSPDYQAQLAEIVYYQDEHMGLRIVDRSQSLLPAGNAGTDLIVSNPYTAQPKEISHKPDQALKMAPSVYGISDIPRVSRNIVYHAGANGEEEAVNLAQSIYERQRRRTFAVSLTMAKTIGIRAGDFIRLIISPSESKVSPWSGLWLVSEANHKIDRGAISTDFILERGEIQPERLNFAESSDDGRIISELEAPGQDVNLNELSSSRLTKGGGLQDPSQLYSTINDPNKPIS